MRFLSVLLFILAVVFLLLAGFAAFEAFNAPYLVQQNSVASQAVPGSVTNTNNYQIVNAVRASYSFIGLVFFSIGIMMFALASLLIANRHQEDLMHHLELHMISRREPEE